MKVALVYDRINKWGGAERLLLALKEVFPKAPIFTSVYAPKNASWAKDFDIKPSFLQKIPFIHNHHQKIPFLMPFAFESLDFLGFDVVISITSAEAKGIIVKPGTLHISYCLTPTRYLYSHKKDYLNSIKFKKPAVFVLNKLKKWDQVAAKRPDYYLAISKAIKDRIKKYYSRDSKIIYPPLFLKKSKEKRKILSDKNLNKNFSQNPANYFLLVSRLEPYKKVELAIKVFNKIKQALIIIGTGSQEKRLKNMANNNIKFINRLTDKQLFDYYRSCTALIMPQVEDYGLVSLEAQSFYKPVIAYNKGGAKETVIDNKTGLLFDSQTEESLIKVLKKLKIKKFIKKDFENNLSRFSFDTFKKEFTDFVYQKWQKHQKQI